MSEEPKYIEFEKDQNTGNKEESSILRGLVDGSLLNRGFVRRQTPFLFYLVFLGMIYISNRYHAETLRNRITDLREVTNELRSEEIFVSSQLMKISRQTEVADQVRERGLELKESVDPPRKIVLKPVK